MCAALCDPRKHLSNQNSHNLVFHSNDGPNKWISDSALNRNLQQFVPEPIGFVSAIITSDNVGESCSVDTLTRSCRDLRPALIVIRIR